MSAHDDDAPPGSGHDAATAPTPSAANPYAPGPQAPTSSGAAPSPGPYNPYGPATPAAGPYNPYGPPPTAPPPAGSLPSGPPPVAGAASGGSPYPAPATYPLRQRPPFPGVGWFMLLLLIGFVLQLIITTLGLITVALIVGMSPERLLGSGGLANVPPAGFFAVLLAGNLSWLVVALASARIAGVWCRDTFRLRTTRLPAYALSILLGLALVPIALTLEHVMARYMPREGNPMVQIMTRQPSTAALVLLGLALTVAAPVGEELLFRGLGLRGLERRYGLPSAIFIVSLFFAAVHLNLTGFVPLALVSVLLCWVTARTDSILPAMLLHAAYNGLQYLMMVSGDTSPEAVKKALQSTSFPMPAWMVLAGVLLGAASVAGLWGLTRRRAAPVD